MSNETALVVAWCAIVVAAFLGCAALVVLLCILADYAADRFIRTLGLYREMIEFMWERRSKL